MTELQIYLYIQSILKTMRLVKKMNKDGTATITFKNNTPRAIYLNYGVTTR